jgi:Flp pilus assembly secretin CpaC
MKSSMHATGQTHMKAAYPSFETPSRGRLLSTVLTFVLTAFAVLVILHLAQARPVYAAEVSRLQLGLSPGEQRVLPGEGVDQLSTSVAGVVDVRVTDDQKQIVVVAAAPGTTTLLILMKNGSRVEYSITVSHIRPRRNIRLDIYVIQVQRGRGLQLGILWPGSLSVTGSAEARINHNGEYSGSLNFLSSDIIPRIDLARNRGWAKVLDQASIVAANGEEGTYSNGGQINVKVASGFASNLEKIAYGTTITARLAYDEVSGRIEGQVKAEVTKLTASATDGLPGINGVRVETKVNIELGQSVALAGLFSDDESSDLRGLPLLSELPILGYFFGARATRQQHLENVIFVVPSLVGAVALEQRDRVSEAFKLYRRYEGDDDEMDLMKLGQDLKVRPAPVQGRANDEARSEVPRPTVRPVARESARRKADD